MLILAGIVLWAAFLRLWRCDSSLPGLQVDEASNAWNAWCLLKTGKDEWGQRWPILYTRAYDDYRSPLYLYLLMPFQMIGGMNVCTTRLPAAIGGVVTVLLVYYIGRRLFDVPTGLVAAALLAISPWHIQHTRWGHEGCLLPLLVAGAVAALVWATRPIVDQTGQTSSRPVRFLLAGLVVGLACHGYGGSRVFVPVALLAFSIVSARWWWPWARSSRAAMRSVALLVLGVVISLGPLVVRHFTDAQLNSRAVETSVWRSGESPATNIATLASRYLAHFGPDFLLRSGRTYAALSPPPGYGWLAWYMVPLLLIGIIVLLRRWRSSISARLVVVLLVCYPAADVLFGDEFGLLHPLRAYPGVLAFCLAGAVGLVGLMRWLSSRPNRACLTAASAFGVWVLLSHGMFVHTFFGSFNDDPAKFRIRHVDLMQACAWLKPRLAATDAVFITQTQMILTQQAMLVHLQHDPHDWFEGPRLYVSGTLPNPQRVACARVGKLRFLVNDDVRSELAAMSSDDRRQKVVLIVRPTEHALAGERAPAHIIQAVGHTWLLIYEFEL